MINLQNAGFVLTHNNLVEALRVEVIIYEKLIIEINY